MYLSGKSLPGAGDYVRANAAPQVYDHIVENVSNMSMTAIIYFDIINTL